MFILDGKPPGTVGRANMNLTRFPFLRRGASRAAGSLSGPSDREAHVKLGANTLTAYGISKYFEYEVWPCFTQCRIGHRFVIPDITCSANLSKTISTAGPKSRD
ncbi:uncharacterized protein PGTG_20607 [Puccinia graminis f. sp. tritici CRL 75-36-700-3]|uniref:Uncharacterized protein n=1 Tax=Puccinia graminis f. sp. tritici (strain CRL 75-36-700-3 / race SCCL) TaxID=418459 RepID=H6QNW4_PUCGT|nr:uncharacterized protein PGTG_20607 [Puccinia graminis f. sp. tritici CRL 75-36-700-3]EHS62484.1 hypothetical protein PGTG_20607 [Puccinia graminis f. sp. tritici CRL 75-36-700-3]